MFRSDGVQVQALMGYIIQLQEMSGEWPVEDWLSGVV